MRHSRMNLYFTKNFTFLGQGSYEITGGGGGRADPPLGIRCGSKTLGIRRVKSEVIKDVRRWQMLTVRDAETLCGLLAAKGSYFLGRVWVTDVPEGRIL